MMDIADNNRVKLLEFLRKRIASRPDRTAGSPFGENWDEINSTQPPAFVPVVGVQKPYRKISGAHPDAVERVWDTLGSVLPRDCRSFVYGAPAFGASG
jgi:hypothetical protein